MRSRRDLKGGDASERVSGGDGIDGEGRGEDRSPGVSHRRSGIRREGEQE